MTYAPTVELLKAVALSAGARSFWHGKKAQGNINYNEPFPQAHLIEMESPIVNGFVKHRVLLYFIAKDEHENGSEDSIRLQDEMDILSQQFFALLAEQDGVEIEGTIQRGAVVREGGKIGTGFLCSFTLNSLALC